MPGTTYVYSYLESRGGEFDETIFFGLQYFLKEYLQGKAFTKEDVDEAEQFMNEVFGRADVFDRKIYDYILEKHDGYLPVKIKAVAEGTAVPNHNVLMTIENTDPNCYWLTNFIETLLMQTWYPITVATLSNEIKKVVLSYFKQTASSANEKAVQFVLNDFGFRGVSSVESAGLGGAAHLINFSGSDTIAGSVMAKKYYNAAHAAGLSIPATEHSIVTLLGEEGELEVFKHVLNTFPTGTIACVSDSYNIFRACEQYWGEDLKEQILKRDGTLVIRPDSGDPVKTLLKVFEILMSKFGYTVNDKGYKVLPPQVRVIQGDGISYSSIKDIYEALKQNNISVENLALGMGGALLQKVDRDTQKFALKCSYAEVNGKEINVMKSPVELNAQGELTTSYKKSKAGKFKLIRQDDVFKTVTIDMNTDEKDYLVTVFENGQLVKEYTFDEVRANAAI